MSKISCQWLLGHDDTGLIIGRVLCGLQGPGLIKAAFGSLRGYAGNISAAGALDAVSNDGNTLIIDIRSAAGCMLLLRRPHSCSGLLLASMLEGKSC